MKRVTAMKNKEKYIKKVVVLLDEGNLGPFLFGRLCGVNGVVSPYVFEDLVFLSSYILTISNKKWLQILQLT